MGKILDGVGQFLNHDEAFGMPPGTVRGIAFIGLTFTICLLAWTGKAIPDPLSMAWAAVIGHYFGEKAGQLAQKSQGPKP